MPSVAQRLVDSFFMEFPCGWGKMQRLRSELVSAGVGALRNVPVFVLVALRLRRETETVRVGVMLMAVQLQLQQQSAGVDQGHVRLDAEALEGRPLPPYRERRDHQLQRIALPDFDAHVESQDAQQDAGLVGAQRWLLQSRRETEAVQLSGAEHRGQQVWRQDAEVLLEAAVVVKTFFRSR